jgi:cold shock CspA family protein/uncharacterized LabA/DUF88 family protein
MTDKKQSLVRVGIFYDGNYFSHVSNYYAYAHERKSRISISGLHKFVRNEVAKQLDVNLIDCQIVDAHYFRGRLSAYEASASGNMLYYERVFDDILMSEGIVTHYLPLKNISGKKEEKGIDVWLALEAFELAHYKKFDLLVLIACDGDYVPLVRKLNALGTRVMLLSWNFEYINSNKETKTTKTSQDLLDEVSYPIAMHEFIDDKKNEALVQNLFVKKVISNETANKKEDDYKTSEIFSLKNGYGFIKHPPNNLFFHYSTVNGVEFSDLKHGDAVKFKIGKNDKGEDMIIEVQLINN